MNSNVSQVQLIQVYFLNNRREALLTPNFIKIKKKGKNDRILSMKRTIHN